MSDALHEAFFALHHGLPRQGPGSDATTRRLLALAGPLPERPRTLDVGCGPGRAALLLAAEAGARVTAVDLHRPFLDELRERAAARGLSDRIRIERHSMTALPYPDGAFDLIWAEGSAYLMGFDAALRSWRRLLAPGGVLVVTECEWATDSPAPRAAAFWAQAGALRSGERNTAAAEAAGYRVLGVHELPDSDWFEEYYDPLARHADAADPARPGMAQAIAGAREEIAVRRAHGADYRYRGYVLTPADTEEKSMWTTRAERPGSAGAADRAAIREVLLGAFPTPLEADLVEALRADESAWLPELSVVAQTPDGTIAGYALITRGWVDGEPVLTLAPCAVRPEFQRQGAGAAAIRAALEAARARDGERLVTVLGHPEYYPRFGFTPASGFGIRVGFEVPDEAIMVLALTEDRPLPAGTIRYPEAFGV
ncbi:hypothetical protein GCM10009757_50490 [Streptomyces cheonanensis]|uniref:N-acetyltransferase domain-containing protein n=1 Tax=Streptomyces cheonanensis TaxID=312720 RepID=A0ABN2VKK7_9ACTN|nr:MULTISPECIES: bifunctional class I SAM-dependent methyltransferase/N-acetyltransferase [Streptomyces]